MGHSEMYGVVMLMESIKGLLQDKGLTFTGESNKFIDTASEFQKINQSLANSMQLFQNQTDKFNQRIESMTLNLDALVKEVERVQAVHQSTQSLLKGLTDELERVSAELVAKAVEVPPVMDTTQLDELIEKIKSSTDSLAGAVAASADVIATKKVVLHADDVTKPTVEVVMPEVLPPVVSVTTELAPGVVVVDPASPEPQVIVTVAPATVEEVAAEVVSEVIVTPPEQTNVEVIALVEEHKVAVEVLGVDPVAEAVAAFEAMPEVVAAPVVEAPVEAVVEPVAEPVVEVPVVAVEAPVEPVAEPVVEAAVVVDAVVVADVPVADVPVADVPVADVAVVVDAPVAEPVVEEKKE